MDSFCLAKGSKSLLLLSMVAALRREMNVFLEDIGRGLRSSTHPTPSDSMDFGMPV